MILERNVYVFRCDWCSAESAEQRELTNTYGGWASPPPGWSYQLYSVSREDLEQYMNKSGQLFGNRIEFHFCSQEHRDLFVADPPAPFRWLKGK